MSFLFIGWLVLFYPNVASSSFLNLEVLQLLQPTCNIQIRVF